MNVLGKMMCPIGRYKWCIFIPRPLYGHKIVGRSEMRHEDDEMGYEMNRALRAHLQDNTHSNHISIDLSSKEGMRNMLNQP